MLSGWLADKIGTVKLIFFVPFYIMVCSFWLYSATFMSKAGSIWLTGIGVYNYYDELHSQKDVKLHFHYAVPFFVSCMAMYKLPQNYTIKSKSHLNPDSSVLQFIVYFLLNGSLGFKLTT